MSLWIPDFREQISFAKFLFFSRLLTGKRLGFIVLDNTVELMFKVYLYYIQNITKRKRGGVTLKDWEDNSSFFKYLLKQMRRLGRLDQNTSDDIKRFHETRCELYHSDTPLVPRDTDFDEYYDIVLRLFTKCFKKGFSTSEQTSMDNEIRKTLGATPCPELPPREVEGDPLEIAIKKTGESLSLDHGLLDNLAIRIRAVFYGLQRYFSVMPVTTVQIQHTLRLNGIRESMEKIQERIHTLKGRGDFEEYGEGYYITELGINKLRNYLQKKLQK